MYCLAIPAKVVTGFAEKGVSVVALVWFVDIPQSA